MKVQELAISPPADQPRTGLHLSSIIKWLLVQRDAKRYGQAPDDGARWMWELGLAWEDRALAHPDVQCHPLKRQLVGERDGILMTVDAVCRKCRTVIECKLTELSSAHSLETAPEFWGHRMQVLGYLHLYGWERAIMPVFYLRGDYREQRRAVRLYEIHASRMDKLKNWQIVLNAKADMEDGQAAAAQVALLGEKV